MFISVCNETCIGARHQRLGQLCQDASSSCSGVTADGTPYGLLIVADGHGHARHSRSDAGAILACELSQQLAIQALKQHGSHAEELPEWFRLSFPQLLVDSWRRAINMDSQQHHHEVIADPISYGTTLGLALLTPNWWLCVGIGDWDLVMISQNGAALVSQERSELTPGESTFSLCLIDPLGPMTERFAMGQIGAEEVDLVLCTDGIRKSCRSDADFLTLCIHLATETRSITSLKSTLKQITSLGSNDDVSIAAAASRNSTHFQDRDIDNAPVSNKPMT